MKAIATTYTITLVAEPQSDGRSSIANLKAFLKLAHRAWGFRCITAVESKAGGTVDGQQATEAAR